MGIVYAKLKLLNAIDVGLFKRGMLEEAKIRQADVNAIVDSGASTIAVPTRLAVQLGLDHVRFTEAQLANAGSEKVEVVGPVEIRFENRVCALNALVLGDEVLLGAIAMEDMDVLIDPKRQKLIVNPESPYLPRMFVR